MRFLVLITIMTSLPAAVTLSTLPERERVRIRFEDTGEVLVSESRALTLTEGGNRIDFTWLGVRIERGSIVMHSQGGVPFQVLRTTYPPEQDNSLRWQVSAAEAGAADVRIAYLMHGLSREVAMRAVIGRDQRSLDLRVDQRLRNDSGEGFEDVILAAPFGEPRQADLANGEVRRQLVHEFRNVPFERQYSWHPHLSAVQVELVLDNSAAGGLGRGLLPGGKVRLFQAAEDGEAFLGEDWAEPTARGEELRLRLGENRDLSVRRAQLDQEQVIIQRDNRGRPALWHVDRHMRYEVENFTDGVRTVRLHEPASGDWIFRDVSQILEKRIAPEEYERVPEEPLTPAVLHRESAEELEIHVTVPAMRRVVLTGTMRVRNLH
ncbi:MAG: hypothetical protein ACOCXJ_05205 [Planctomycetota bacterium]